MFSKRFSPKGLTELLGATPPSANELDELLKRESFDLASLARLILASGEVTLRRKIIDKVVCCREKTWRRQLFLMPPLYISDGNPKKGGCVDVCLYCPWRNGNVPTDKLLRLTTENIGQEAARLLKLGYGGIELVAATDPELLKVGNVVKAITAVRGAGARDVGINFFPLGHAKDYREIAAVGCTFVIVWQETYFDNVYGKVHPRGPKSDMTYRLDAHDRALQGGIKTVGVAFLGGLADWRFDTLATLAHALYLRKEYGARIIFGMPRWKSGPGIPMDAASVPYGDMEYEFVGALYSLAIPEALPWFSTRENFDLSARCANGGGCMFTLDCSTEVGGYTRQGGFAQFPVYSRPFGQGIEWLRERGFNPKIHLPW